MEILLCQQNEAKKNLLATLKMYISYLYLSEKFYCIIYKITNLKVYKTCIGKNFFNPFKKIIE